MAVLEASPRFASATERQALLERLAVARERTEEALVELDQSLERVRTTRENLTTGRTEREVLRDSALARALARLSTQAAIEQAKGIIIAQRACTPEEAFDVLRRASQRTNVPVRDLAASLVERTAVRGRQAS